MIYISIFALTLFGSLGYLIKKFPIKLYFYFISSLLILMVALRFESTDYYGYLRIYEQILWNNIANLGLFSYYLTPLTPIETGFTLFVLFEKFLFGHFYIFIALFGFIGLVVKFAAFRKMSPYVLLSLLVYISNEYFWNDLGQMRNGFASGIILWALYYAYLKRLFLFLLLVFCASQFHNAALVAIPFYLLNTNVLSIYRNRTVMLTCLVFSFLVVIVFGGLGSLIVDISSLLGFEDSSRIIKHANGKYVVGHNLFGGTILLQTLLSTIFVLLYKKHIKKFALSSYFTPVYVYTTCLFIGFNDYAIIGSRINDMLVLPIGCILIPSLLLLFNNKSKNIVLAIIYSYCILWFYLMMIGRKEYKSILSFIW